MSESAWNKFWKRLRLVPAVEVDTPVADFDIKKAELTETRSEGILTRPWPIKRHKHFFRLAPSGDSAYLRFECECHYQYIVSKWVWKSKISDGVQRKIFRIANGTSTTDPFVEFNGNWTVEKYGR